MKMFSTSNQVYYHDVVAGITKLLFSYLKHRSKVENYFHDFNANGDVDVHKCSNFVRNFSKYQPKATVIIS